MPSQLFNLYTSNNGTLAESQAKISSLAVTSDEYNSLIFDRKRHSIWAQGEEYGRGSDAFDKAANSWTATVKGQTWSRILYVPYYENVSGASYIIQVQATRSSVVYNDTFFVTAHHSKNGQITKVNGSKYGSNIKVRILVDSGGNSYFDIYDACNSIANTTTQLVKCSFIGINTGTMTSANYYTTFTDDTTIPTNFALAHELLTSEAGIDARSLVVSSTGSRDGIGIRRISDGAIAFMIGNISGGNGYQIGATGGNSYLSFWTNNGTAEAEKLKIDKDGHLLPGTTNTQNIGSSSLRWANIYSTLGNFSGQITSSVATGTAPFAITSTTAVTNLNADMVDGKHASDFAASTHTHYVGTTQVQSASNPQALTGITSINGCVTITSGSDIASIGFIGNHSVEFGNSGYAHRSYYFRPAYSASGATQTNLYIQNASAAASPTFTTTHAFTANGNAYHSGNIIIETGDNDRYIHFRYDSNNYAGASWRLISRGSGTSDTNYFDIETGGSTSTANTWYRVIRLTMDNRYVGIGTDSPTQKLHVGGNGRFDGGIGSKGTNGNVTGAYIVHPSGGVYTTNTSSVTGYLKITLPHKGKNTMMSFDVTIYTYDGDYQSYVTYHISGYEYSTNGWYNPVTKVYSEGIGPYTNLTVRLGNDGTYACVTIGESDTVWTYPQVTVHNIMTGYSNCNIDTWISGWSVGFTTTALTTVVSEKTSVNKQNISVTSADKLNFERVSDIHATTGWRVFTTTNNTPSNGPSSNWMQGITFLPNNDQNGYRNILAFLGAGTNNDLWIQTQSGGTWGDWRKVLTSANYTSYLGYIGTTAVQANSANQDLTGINTLTITNTTATGHIKFSRASWNYLTAPASGAIAFVTNGKTAGSANTDLVVKNTEVSPGTNLYSSLGSTSVRWNGIYASIGDFTGSLQVVNDSCNNSTNALAYFRHYSNNDWGIIIDKSSSYSYGLNIEAGGNYALRVNNGVTRLIGSTIIGSDSVPSYPLHVVGDIYSTAWSRAANGFYVHDKGVHYMSNGTYKAQIYVSSSSGNEVDWQIGDSNKVLYFNKTASSNGYAPTKYVWNDGTATGYASHELQSITMHGYINSCKIFRFTVPQKKAAEAGWYRIGQVTGIAGYLNCIMLIHGVWSTGAPSSSFIHISAVNTTPYITFISGAVGNTTAVRLVNISGGSFYLDVKLTGVGADATRGAQRYTVIGNISITESYEPTEKIADASDTAGTIVNLSTVTGVNITSSNIGSYATTASGHNHDKRYTINYNASATANTYNGPVNNASSSVTVNDLAAAGISAVGMINSATDNPVGSASWVHVWSQAWQAGVNTSWVSQIALGASAGTGMWYRTSSGTAVGRAWIRVLDSSNYTSYAHPKNGKISIAGGSYSWYSIQQYNSSDANPSYYSATCAIINITSYSGWQPWIRAVDSEKGNWTIGQYTTNFHIGYIPKSNTTNALTHNWTFTKDGETDIPGTLRIRPKTGSYTEGIRIYPYSSWSTIMLGGNDMTANNGTSANSWGIFNNNGTFYINKNASSAAGAPRVMGTSTGWTFGNTSTNSYAVNAPQMLADTWMRAGSGFYCENTGVHFTHQGNHGEIDIQSSNELLLGSNAANLYINYRAVSRGTTATNYIWNAGSSSSWATHNMGNIWLNGSGVYLRLGPQNSSHAHYETNAGTSHWFNKRVDVNGAIWVYNTNYGMAANGRLYSLCVYANRSGSGTDGGVSLYTDTDPMTYGVAFRQTGTYGKLGRVQGDWATYFTMNDTTNRGWIFRAGSNYASISSRGEAYFLSVGADAFIMNPGGGRYVSSTSSVTGALCIELPVSWTNTMHSFDVIIFDYAGNSSCVYHVGGYNYSSDSKWYNVTAYSSRYSNNGYGNRTVRFGHNGTHCCIYIGETNSTWPYPQVCISNVQLGFNNYTFNTWASGWKISFVTTLGTITQTVTNPAMNYYADTWDGYHLVVGSTGTAANTIYIL